MSKEAYILEKLIAKQIDIVGDLIRDTSEDHKFYAFIHVKRNKDGAQRPSNHKLNLLSDSFEKENIHISFILVEDGTEDIQASIKNTLFRFFPEAVRNGFIAPEKKGITVWIEPKKSLTIDEEKAIKSKTQELCNVLEVTLNDVKITSSENIPTPTACLSVIRQKAPITMVAIKAELLQQKFHVPNDDWLSKMIDKLRKAQRVLRHKNGCYTLTLTGLKSLGSSKNRKSPDIRRALDFARRRE